LTRAYAALVPFFFGAALLLAFGVSALMQEAEVRPPASPRPAAQRFYQRSGPELSAAATSFAEELRGLANATAVANHSTAFVSHVSCVQGAPTQFECAYWVSAKGCRLARVDRSTASLQVLSVWKVDLPLRRCGVLAALRSL